MGSRVEDVKAAGGRAMLKGKMEHPEICVRFKGEIAPPQRNLWTGGSTASSDILGSAVVGFGVSQDGRG